MDSVERDLGKTLLRAGSIVILFSVLIFFVKFFKARRVFWQLRAKGLSMPPWHPLFGHLRLASNILGAFPPGAHGHYLCEEIRKRYPDLGPVYYLDLWPFSVPFLVTTSPSVTSDLMKRLPAKDPSFLSFMRPITGGEDMLCSEGELWKHWRSIFNPGFSQSHIMTLVPEMIKDVLVFRDILREHAKKGDIFRLEDQTINLTLDIIGRVVLDTDFNQLRGQNDMVAALRSQIAWSNYGNDATLKLPNPFRPIIHWYNAWRMDRYLIPEVSQRYHNRLSSGYGPKSNPKSIIDLALQSHLVASPDPSASDPFIARAAAQTKLFLFAGHDTTSGTLCYAYHLLSTYPQALATLRAEHAHVLGHVSTSSTRIATTPHLLNSLPYTTAVLRETLRLFPPASIVRAGAPDLAFAHPTTGHLHPSQGMYIWAVHHEMHRDPALWPRPNEFLPERWLVPEGDVLHQLDKEAWRPFERGPRACVGQDLAMTEMKLCLALTARELDVRTVYEEWDWGKRRGQAGWAVNGEKGFQVAIGAAHPREGMPVRVEVVEKDG